MSIDPRPVIKEIERHGGRLPAQLLSNLLGEVFRPERNQREPEIPPPLLGMAGGADELDYRRTNPPVGQPFNLIPSPPGAGTYCPLCFGGGGDQRLPDRVLRALAEVQPAHVHPRGSPAETLTNTPDWNQRVFEDRLARLNATAATVFILECAPTIFIRRFSY
jgi:hypothetical protein